VVPSGSVCEVRLDVMIPLSLYDCVLFSTGVVTAM
jgi:hypothetical protein